MGEDVNVGAGVITCNYDGLNKHPTTIGDGAFVGTNASLVAPITIGANAYVGAGSTVTKDVPPGALVVERSVRWSRTGGGSGRSASAPPEEEEGLTMCGIVGYVGEKSAVGIIVDGLKKLEYRGYDSAGVAILQGTSWRCGARRAR